MDTSQDLEGEADVLLKREGTSLKLDGVESCDILRASDKGTLQCQRIKSWNFARQFYLWIRTLKEAFGAPFLSAIIIVYGISQGYVGTVRSLATNYYWKDVQKLQPATTQAFQVAYCAIGLVDLAIVRRWNLQVGVPDHAFVVGDAVVGEAIGRLQLIPFMVLSSRLCPPGIEGTVFAFLMSLSNFGATCASWAGALLMRCLGVHRSDYSHLWLAVILRSLMRLLPLVFLFLLPSGTAQDLQTPTLFPSPSQESSSDPSSLSPTHDHEHPGRPSTI